MKCSIQGCPGEYEKKHVFHTVRHKGQIKVIDHVPADVCLICGDVLFRPEIVRNIEKVLKESTQPISSVPLCEYA
jgi:YgiT-type zinc finger domain-containing protein